MARQRGAAVISAVQGERAKLGKVLGDVAQELSLGVKRMSDNISKEIRGCDANMVSV